MGAAFQASEANLLYNSGVMVKVTWRLTASKTQDTRDFDAVGCNMGSSRDMYRQIAKQRAVDRGDSRAMALEDSKRDKEKKKRSRSRSKKQERSEKKKRSRSRSDKKKKCS